MKMPIAAKHESLASKIIVVITIAVLGLVIFMGYATPPNMTPPFDISGLPKLHAILNACVTVCLIISGIAIFYRNIKIHMMANMGAFMLSTVFLLSYVTYHTFSESTKFGDLDGDGVLNAMEYAQAGSKRILYFLILITHIVLAAGIFPLILFTFLSALTGQFGKHKKLVRYTYPLWLYVSITGVVIYWMISPYYQF